MILYGISNCDTVRKARKFLETHKIQHRFHDFRKEGITVATIENWLKIQPIELIVNQRSTSWKQITDEQKTELMAGENLSLLTEHPTLIKRPVLEFGSTLWFGFNSADYEGLL